MKNILFKIFIGLSVFIGTVVTFVLYLNRRLIISEELNNKIIMLMEEISVESDKQWLFLVVLSIIYCLIFFILGFVVYKIIFKLSGIKVPDGRLILTIGTAYMISYLVGYFVAGSINDILLTLLTNLVEVCIVFAVLFDYIQKKLLRCGLLRGLLLLGNIAIAL